MKICTVPGNTNENLTRENQIKALADAGFDGIDYSLFHYPIDSGIFTSSDDEFRAYFTHLGEYAESCGIAMNQVHSPMPSYTGDKEKDKYLLEIQKKSIIAAYYLKSKYIIIHPCIPREYRYTHFRAECREINFEFYNKLRPLLEKYQIKLCVENMFNWDPKLEKICPTVCSDAEEMIDYIDNLGRDVFCACLDIGHSVLSGSGPKDMITKLGDRIETLHVHDNDGRNDYHLVPGLGRIDWDECVTALTDIGYKGMFSIEAGDFFHTFRNVPYEDSANYLYKICYGLVGNK
ncbi:MAG: sugar phosphate isomerase/epimerase [Clostridiales bacterium]|nr:sugar phosphate isomerase/epimerase [Clostridiales bacterium]